jgi:hypothetical protein
MYFQHLTEDARVRSQANHCQIRGGQSGTVTGVCPKTFGFPPAVSFHQCSTLIFSYMLLLPEGQAGEAWEPSESDALQDIGEQWTEK